MKCHTLRGQPWSLPPRRAIAASTIPAARGAGPAADALSVVCSASVRGRGLRSAHRVGVLPDPDDVETHVAVFTWVLERLAGAGLVQGKTVGVDATTLEANAAMRSIERRDTGESYEAFVRQLAKASGIETPTRAELARFDRSRKDRKTSNKEWQSPQDTDAKIAKMKDGRTHLAHKAEHGIDLETGAILSVTVQEASEGDSATLPATLTMAAEQVEAVQPAGAEVEPSPALHLGTRYAGGTHRLPPKARRRCRRLRTGWKASPPRARPGRLPLKSPSRFRAHCRHWKRLPPMLPRRSRPARWSSNSERNTLQLSSATRA